MGREYTYLQHSFLFMFLFLSHRFFVQDLKQVEFSALPGTQLQESGSCSVNGNGHHLYNGKFLASPTQHLSSLSKINKQKHII